MRILLLAAVIILLVKDPGLASSIVNGAASAITSVLQSIGGGR